MHLQPSRYGAQPRCTLENTLKKLTQELDRAKVASRSRVSPTGMEGTNHIGEEPVVKEMTIYLLMNPDSEADFRYKGDERSDTDQDRCRERYRQKKKSDKKSRGEESKQKKYMDSSDSD